MLVKANIIRLYENERVAARATVHDGSATFPAPLGFPNGRTIRPRSPIPAWRAT